MRRKRRKAYKKWKMLTSSGCASQTSGQASQKNMKGLEKEVKGDTSEAVFHQAGALGKSKGNGDECTSASINRRQNSSFLSKDEKQPPPDSNIHQSTKTNDSPSAVAQQLEKGLPVAMFNDCDRELSGKITILDFPSTEETLKPVKSKFLTEIKCGAFTVQVDTRKNIFCKTGAQFLTKKRCPTCHQQFSVQQIRRSSTSRTFFSKYSKRLADKSKHKVSSTCTVETARTETPSLNVCLLGKEIKVEYMSEKQKIFISITQPKRRGKLTKHRSLSSGQALQEPVGSPSHAPINPERCWSENTCLTSDFLHDSSTADATQESLDPAVSKKNMPSTPPSASEDTNTADTLCPKSCDTLRTTSLNNTELSKAPVEDPNGVDKERKSSFDIRRIISSNSHTQLCTEGANGSLSAVMGILPLQGAPDSDLCSLMARNPQITGEKAANIHGQGRKPPPAQVSEHANVTSVSFSQSVLRSSPSLSPSHWATTHSEPVETPVNAKFETDQEKVHVTDRDIAKAVLHCDSHKIRQSLLDRNSTQSPTFGLAPCGSLASGSPLHSTDKIEDWENHAETAVFNRTKVPVTASITNDMDQAVITQNDKEETVDSKCPMGVRNPEELPPSLEDVEEGKCQGRPVVKHLCYQGGEALAGENHEEVCFPVDFPPDATEFSCAAWAMEELLLIERTQTNTEDLYHIQGKIHQESAQCQKAASARAHAEDESQSDCKEASHPPEEVSLSTLEQKALTDQNLEISSLRKLSQDSSLRGGRASDGSQEEAVDQWARRRQQFKDRKRCSSTGGSSFASTVTEGSVSTEADVEKASSSKFTTVTSDDTHSMDLVFRVDIGEKGFYTENFHSAAWVFLGDDGNPEDGPICLSNKPGPVAVRERTVRLFKGTGDYPWGFRIQFSKPIMVTEVDTNSAAQEAGLQIGDVVLSVNGTEVTSVEHAEAVHLARKGPDILTLVVGSDISRCPNTPWPTCRGYLHKRTQSGFMKGWRKRWFVLKYDGYLHYYKHKKDEGKCPPLEVIKLEGSEVDIDTSLGKPFVFNCVPQSGNRNFCLCAASNQEMKRWLEAMHRAAHPTRQNHVWEDVTLHNSNLPPLAIKNPECLGLLHQLERSGDTWVQHYCILKDGCLYFYTSIRSTQASGGLYLQGYRVSEQTHNFKQSVIELKPPSEEFQTFYFCAENKTENQRWITALKMSIKKWLPLDQAIHEFMNRPLEETRM